MFIAYLTVFAFDMPLHSHNREKIMAIYPEYISVKRIPAPTPDSIVENGEVHYGTFERPFKNLNLLDAENPCGKLPAFMKKSRLVEWEAFEVNMDEGTLISAVYNTNGMGFSLFVWYDKEENKIYSWRNVVPRKKAKVASQLIDDYCYCKTNHSEYRINNDFLNGKASAKGHSKGKAGTFSIDMKFERVAPLANGVMPLAKNKDGSLRNPLYTEKDFFKATGNVTVNGKAFITNERSVGIIDDHKGYYPYRAHSLPKGYLPEPGYGLVPDGLIALQVKAPIRLAVPGNMPYNRLFLQDPL